jgi:hypothetical protein
VLSQLTVNEDRTTVGVREPYLHTQVRTHRSDQ